MTAVAGTTAAVVVSWEGGEATRRCVESLRAQTTPPTPIVVVDNASSAAERDRLHAAFDGVPGVRLLLLDDNRQFAGGMNAGAEAALAAGAERLLLLNNDTVVAPDAVERLVAALAATPGAGIAGPRVLDVGADQRELSAGERHSVALLCVPRTLLRHRAHGDAPYPVSGVMGCALLVSRACFEAVGGFSTEIAVYYEDVDFCIAAHARGFGAVIAPRAIVRHDGMRGFLRGLTPWAAFLKARNPWLVVRRHGSAASWLWFLPQYAALIGGSAILYACRGRRDVARALVRGAVAGLRLGAGGAAAPVTAPGRGT